MPLVVDNAGDALLMGQALQILGEPDERAFSLGADEFVHKPMDLDVYKAAVCSMIQKWAPREESGTPV